MPSDNLGLDGGKYDAPCALVRDATQAAGCLLIVIGGSGGSGFSVSATREVIDALPRVLRAVADDIERQHGQTRKN